MRAMTLTSGNKQQQLNTSMAYHPALCNSKVGNVRLPLASGREVEELVPWTSQHCLRNKSCYAFSGTWENIKETLYCTKQAPNNFGNTLHVTVHSISWSPPQRLVFPSSSALQLDEQCSALSPELVSSPVPVAWESAKRCSHQKQEGDETLSKN